MYKVAGTVNLSADELVGHLNYRDLTLLDLKVVNGELDKPKIWDPELEVLNNLLWLSRSPVPQL